MCRLCDQQPVGIDGVCPACWVLLASAVDNAARYEPNRVIDLTEIEARLSAYLRA